MPNTDARLRAQRIVELNRAFFERADSLRDLLNGIETTHIHHSHLRRRHSFRLDSRLAEIHAHLMGSLNEPLAHNPDENPEIDTEDIDMPATLYPVDPVITKLLEFLLIEAYHDTRNFDPKGQVVKLLIEPSADRPTLELLYARCEDGSRTSAYRVRHHYFNAVTSTQVMEMVKVVWADLFPSRPMLRISLASPVTHRRRAVASDHDLITVVTTRRMEGGTRWVIEGSYTRNDAFANDREAKSTFRHYTPYHPSTPDEAYKRVWQTTQGEDRGAVLPNAAYRYLLELHPDAYQLLVYQWGWPHFGKSGNFVFTENPSKFERDVVTPIRPGRWLKRVLPDATAEQVKKFSALVMDGMDFTVHCKNMNEPDAADVIEKVYTSGPSSCMSHSVDDRFGKHTGGIHPMTIFAHPESDVQLFWMTNTSGSIIARCLARKSQRSYVRIYVGNNAGDNALNFLRGHMADVHGITDEEYGCLTGAICSKIVSPRGYVIAPYIDVDNLGLYDKGDHLIVADGCEYDIKGYYETGVDSSYNADDHESVDCECCGESFDQEDMNSTADGQVCDSCLSENYHWAINAAGNYYYMHYDDVVHVECVETYVASGVNSIPLAVRRAGLPAIVYSEIEADYILVEDAEEVTTSLQGAMDFATSEHLDSDCDFTSDALGAPTRWVAVSICTEYVHEGETVFIYDGADPEALARSHGITKDEYGDWCSVTDNNEE